MYQQRIEIEPFFPANDEYFTYLDPYSAESRRKALADLENYVAEEGPFDGVMAFSLGAALAATFIIRKLQANPLERRTSLPFKCAIFLSGGIPFDYLAVPLDEIQSLWVKDEQPIQVPTAHIWGSNDALADSTSAVLSELCNPQLRTVFIHDGGHDVPGARSRDATIGMVRAIRHTIDLCDF